MMNLIKNHKKEEKDKLKSQVMKKYLEKVVQVNQEEKKKKFGLRMKENQDNKETLDNHLQGIMIIDKGVDSMKIDKVEVVHKFLIKCM